MPINSITAGTGIRLSGPATDPTIGLIAGVYHAIGGDHKMTGDHSTVRVSPLGATRTVWLPHAKTVHGRMFVIQRVPGDEDSYFLPPNPNLGDTTYTNLVKVETIFGDTIGPRVGNTFRYLSTGSDQLVVQAYENHWIILNTEAHVYDILDFGADPTGVGDSQPACQAASDLGSLSGGAVILYAPQGWYSLAKTWTIVGGPGRSVVLTGVGPGNSNGTCFMPHPEGFDPQYTDPNDPRSPVWNLTQQYYAPQRYTHTAGGGYQYGGFGSQANNSQSSQIDYKPLIRTRKLYQGSYIRNLTLLGVNGTARCGKGIWVDWWFEGDVGHAGYTPSNGLCIENVSLGRFTDVLNDAPNGSQPNLPAFAVQVGAYDSTGVTLQAANVRLSNVQVNGGAPGGKTDVGLWYHTGNVKNFVVANCNIGNCRYGIRTSGSGYFLITGCDFASSGRIADGWNDGADFLIPQSFVTIVGCGSEGSRRSIIGEGNPGGVGAVTMIGSYWTGVLPFDWDAEKLWPTDPNFVAGTTGCFGAVIRNINQSFAFHGCRFLTGGGWGGAAYVGASRIAWDFSNGALSVEGCHIEGRGAEFADPDLFVNGNYLTENLGLNPAYDNHDYYRFTFRHNHANDHLPNSALAKPPVRLANFEHGSGKRLGGNTRKVQQLTQVPQLTQTITLGAYNDVILIDATAGPFDVNLPQAKSCRGREYVIVKIDSSGNAVNLKPYVPPLPAPGNPLPPDPPDTCDVAFLDQQNPRVHLMSGLPLLNDPIQSWRWNVIG